MEESIDYLNLNNKQINITTNKTQNDNDYNDATIDKRAIKELCSIGLIRDYDKDQSEIKFQTSYYKCNVCFVDKNGSNCMKFIGCNHVFCNECMKEYFEIQIKDGNVNNLTCPYEKCETQALPSQVIRKI